MALGGFWLLWGALWTLGWLRVIPGCSRDFNSSFGAVEKIPVGCLEGIFSTAAVAVEKIPVGLLNGYFFNRTFGAVEKIPSRQPTGIFLTAAVAVEKIPVGYSAGIFSTAISVQSKRDQIAVKKIPKRGLQSKKYHFAVKKIPSPPNNTHLKQK